MAQIHLGDGTWILSDCGQMPSEKNCKLIMVAPVDQREDLLDAAVAHAVKHHAHEETPELRGEVSKMLVDLE
ncbi:hypothetical protein A3D80_03620 [Candidatus Roizmanbacteria bacterium RIFCSPHIGHO2_02_FULL_40_13b]|uniref:DUF1059 domain-containing protein n=1 Tax=Candidatus Roizmanbacteria bacterium RIFCSPHIGHO2_01_FULL_39_24 TaxID=1802032 RepID=A0A1F7GIZ1_9BACT|nr:MAG: hypothetical protein A2799_04190 [Candidatus Roizmanbacteria bacterium RIFCSPHIGHO2_01_FULL_39_24]OGK27053.1 MAG: hypothetical protein A3D80_03620 [Candidatus Roizmanbacteria bacterium RIFCSPHIGHO2_02_FULL_40_13b]OGK48791.1 MAG: hypothetical protein A3A56_01100 [Candidatus Roizmanbacteria bacterium RIFCSPLOWO2_01_FULL_40_32]OGK56845.1 MAG: hypothetical protein A3H83_01250 [Candidatus Roizmanbacteria bacterium RIFCSPLOWO2_02_FULL_39_8]